MSTFVDILKSAKTRDEVERFVRKRAVEVASQGRMSVTSAEAAIWRDPAVYKAYEEAPIPKKEVQRPTIRVTKAEAELDRLARQLLKDGRGKLTYAEAVLKTLEDRPQLYALYEIQKRAGMSNETVASDDTTPTVEENADGRECPDCLADADPGDQFCRECGAKLS